MLFTGRGRPIALTRPAPPLPATMGGNRPPIIDLDQLERDATPWVVSYHHRLTAERKPPLAQLPPQARMRRLTVGDASATQTSPWCRRLRRPPTSPLIQHLQICPPHLHAYSTQTPLSARHTD